VILDIKCYIFSLIPSKPALLELAIASITIDHQIVVIHVQVGIFFIEDVLLDGGSKVNIIMKKVNMQLGLSNQHHTTYAWLIKPLLNL
jgi:hypothetical protein